MKSSSNIFLIGFSGSGKSTIGPKLAEKLEYNFYDTDILIEKQTGKKISEIFEYDGEEHFRNLESKTIIELLKSSNKKVISLGGGAFESDKNRSLIANYGLVIYLQCSPDLLWERMKEKNDRPLLNSESDEDLKLKIQNLLSAREVNYKKADVTVDCDNKEISTIIDEIISVAVKNEKH